MNAAMPIMLGWVLGGNDKALRSADRQPHCRIADKPKAFDTKVRPPFLICDRLIMPRCSYTSASLQNAAPSLEKSPSRLVMQDFFKFLGDDMEMLKSARVHWTLVPSAAAESSAQQNSDQIDASQNGKRHTYGLRIAYPEEAKEICSRGLTVGSSPQAHIQLDAPQVISEMLLQRFCGQERIAVCWCHVLQSVLGIILFLNVLVCSGDDAEVCCACHEGGGEACACAAAA